MADDGGAGAGNRVAVGGGGDRQVDEAVGQAQRAGVAVAGVPDGQGPAAELAEGPGEQGEGGDHVREDHVDATPDEKAEEVPQQAEEDQEARVGLGFAQRHDGDVGREVVIAGAGGEDRDVVAAGGDGGSPVVGDAHVGAVGVEFLGDHQDVHAVRRRSCSSARRT